MGGKNPIKQIITSFHECSYDSFDHTEICNGKSPCVFFSQEEGGGVPYMISWMTSGGDALTGGKVKVSTQIQKTHRCSLNNAHMAMRGAMR